MKINQAIAICLLAVPFLFATETFAGKPDGEPPFGSRPEDPGSQSEGHRVKPSFDVSVICGDIVTDTGENGVEAKELGAFISGVYTALNLRDDDTGSTEDNGEDDDCSVEVKKRG